MIEFNGLDIVVQHRIDDDGTRRALATALGLPEGRVALIDDVNDYSEAGAADVVCVSSPVDGEFTRLLSLQVEHLTLPYDTRDQLLQRLCELLGTQCLVPCDGDMDPYVMWSISPGKASIKIALDPIALDEGRYVITRRAHLA